MFIGLAAEVDAEQDELLRGQMSPLSGCSSGDDLMAYDQPVGLPPRHSTPNIRLESAEEGGSTMRFESTAKAHAAESTTSVMPLSISKATVMRLCEALMHGPALQAV